MSAAELWPVNVECLRARRVKFEHRASSHDILVRCPICAGKLILGEAKPFFHCFGKSCHLDRKGFDQVLTLLAEAAK